MEPAEKMTPKGKPMKATQLNEIAKITIADVNQSVVRSHPELSEYINAEV